MQWQLLTKKVLSLYIYPKAQVEKTLRDLFIVWWVEKIFSRGYWKGSQHGRLEAYAGSPKDKFQGKCQNDWNTKEYYL